MVAGYSQPAALQGADRPPHRPSSHHHDRHGLLPVPPHHGTTQRDQAVTGVTTDLFGPGLGPDQTGQIPEGGPEFASTNGPIFIVTAMDRAGNETDRSLERTVTG